MTTKIERLQLQETSRPKLRKLLWVSPLAMSITAIANLSLYGLVGAVFPEVTAWPGASVSQIIGASIIYLLMGTIVFAIIGRYSIQPASHFRLVATVGMLLSLWLPISAAIGYGPPGAPLASTATAVTLSLMHIISYAITVPLFNRLVLS